MVVGGFGWSWVVVGGCGLLWVVVGGFGSFLVLVCTVDSYTRFSACKQTLDGIFTRN